MSGLAALAGCFDDIPATPDACRGSPTHSGGTTLLRSRRGALRLLAAPHAVHHRWLDADLRIHPERERDLRRELGHDVAPEVRRPDLGVNAQIRIQPPVVHRVGGGQESEDAPARAESRVEDAVDGVEHVEAHDPDDDADEGSSRVLAMTDPDVDGVICLPELRGNLMGDKSNSLVFDNSKIARLVPEFHCRKPFAVGIRESITWLRAHPEDQNLNPKIDATIQTLLSAWEESSRR